MTPARRLILAGSIIAGVPTVIWWGVHCPLDLGVLPGLTACAALAWLVVGAYFRWHDPATDEGDMTRTRFRAVFGVKRWRR